MYKFPHGFGMLREYTSDGISVHIGQFNRGQRHGLGVGIHITQKEENVGTRLYKNTWDQGKQNDQPEVFAIRKTTNVLLT